MTAPTSKQGAAKRNTVQRSRIQSSATLELSRADARRLLIAWHLRPTDVRGVIERHGSIQYDPLRPLGTNVDLVLQARVPGYRVDQWQDPVYGERIAFDGWDKQASVVRIEDWPRRTIYHRWHREWWRERVFDRHASVVEDVLSELRARGPLASSDFEDPRRRSGLEGSWHGPSLTKHALRALWHTGQIATHHRRHGHHVYDVAERVIPPELFAAPEPPASEQLCFLVGQRHRAVGLLRPNAEKSVWSLEIPAEERHAIIADLVAAGKLLRVDVEGAVAHAHPAALAALETAPEPKAAVRFLAPLDPMLWDRRAVAEWFEFDYVWEVYKPAKDRIWGYYVLPVLWKDRLVGRLDAKLVDDVFHLQRFWLEAAFEPTAEFFAALEAAFARFLAYLGVLDVRQNPNAHAVTRPVRDALYAAARSVDGGTT